MAGPLDNLPLVHPRTAVMDAAEAELETAAYGIRDRYGLTSAEYLLLMTRAATRFASQLVYIERTRPGE